MKKPKYYLDKNGFFVIENYNFAKPFANFFPGIAGKYGIPMWVFYVNRGQCISSFGIKDKDHSIVEYLPANKAWQIVTLQGFRTFIKLFNNPDKFIFYEPFHNGFVNLGFKFFNRMLISSSDLRIEEENLTLGIKIKVEYFTIPQDNYPGLARIVTIKNIDSKNKRLQVLDGLPQIIPYGVSNLFLKKLSRTIEAWMNVEYINKDVAFYKLNANPTDRPEYIPIKEGSFYLGFYYEENKPKLIKPIVDPQRIFDPVIDFSYPYQFLNSQKFVNPKKEIKRSKTPCGFLLLDLQLNKDEEKTFYCIIGTARSKQFLKESINKITKPDYLITKQKQNQKIIEELQEDISTKSSKREFDLYAKQTYLDNILRGGYPIILSPYKVFYLYLRKHGDLERDYNKFQIQPTYFSQGNGNYRDTNQNRRCDVWFHPEIKYENIVYFLNLIQADGYNPLVLKGITFSFESSFKLRDILKQFCSEKDSLKLQEFLDKPFNPGELILFIEENKIKLTVSYEEFLKQLLSHCVKNLDAEHEEGFWTDHWHYNLDLIENYLSVYPEDLKELVFEKRVFSFFDNTEVVRPRSEKYILRQDGIIRQLHAVCHDSGKKEMLKKRAFYPHLVRSEYGKGQIYQTCLLNKLLCILANKLATLDPFGVGIEMEADKPNWFDALNGLPSLFGSSICETFELKRLILFLLLALKSCDLKKVYITEEILQFLTNLDRLIKDYFKNNSKEKDYEYWDKSNLAKEEYRKKTRFGFSGKEVEFSTDSLIEILDSSLKKVEIAIEKAKDKKSNLYYAYFIHEVKEYQLIKHPFVKPTRFIQKPLPLFLEAQVHALRLAKDIKEAKAIYEAIKKSSLYDKKLKMYKITGPLESMPEEIGRCRIFSPGWLENESIWLHMEYKYILELLKQGLYDEFYQDLKNVLIPFQPPQRYGRSILENSSFIVSSKFPDKSLHGNGFIARLSGSTAEFVNIWLIMNIGLRPFFLNEKKELNLRFSPVLAGWLFDAKDRILYSFKFLSKIWVVYHNPKRKNTFGKNGVKPRKIIFNDKDNNKVEIISDTIPYPYAEQIRAGQIKQINIYLD
ncbi:MAG: cellobiose phosphorylase [Candidatus Omnitrophica bacterium]|nr:cellobiose phosphorylase [Candidatus Omnitrophota bacterium]